MPEVIYLSNQLLKVKTGHRHRVLELASKIEPDPNKLVEWFQNDGIDEFDNFTAKELLEMGRHVEVTEYLHKLLQLEQEPS